MRDTQLGITRRSGRVPLLRLEVLAGAKFGDSFELTAGEHTIGSSRQASVQLPDEGIERRHALVHVEAGRATLEALPTKVGTFRNGARLAQVVELQSGDELEVGGAKLRAELLEVPDEPPPTSSTLRRRRATPDASTEESAPSLPRRRVTSASVRGRTRAVTATADDRPSFGSDQTALYLANFFRLRPKMKFDYGLLENDRTHGYYLGDGQDERTLTLGWQPLHVLFVEPTFAQLGRGWPPTDSQGSFKEIGPHPQPDLLEDGFRVDGGLNQSGITYRYVAFRDRPYRPGPPLTGPAPG